MLMQIAIILAVVTPFSFDLHLGGVLVATLVLSVFSIGVGALSFALALASKGQDWMFWTIQQTLLFPTLLTAGMLLPVEGAPALARGPLDAQPDDVRRRRRARAVRRHLPGRRRRCRASLGAGVVAALGLVVGVRRDAPLELSRTWAAPRLRAMEPERVAAHVAAFIDAVGTGAWAAFGRRFAEDAVMAFPGRPVPAAVVERFRDPAPRAASLFCTRPAARSRGVWRRPVVMPTGRHRALRVGGRVTGCDRRVCPPPCVAGAASARMTLTWSGDLVSRLVVVFD